MAAPAKFRKPNARVEIKGLHGVNTSVSNYASEPKTVSICNCKHSTFTLNKQESGNLLKLCLLHCENVTIHLSSKILTSTLEIAHCSNVKIHLTQGEHTSQTFQIDLSRSIEILGCDAGAKVWHAGCSEIMLNGLMADDSLVSKFEHQVAISCPIQDYQFVTQFATSDDDVASLQTERVYRGIGIMPLRRAELVKVALLDTLDTKLQKIGSSMEAGNEETTTLTSGSHAATLIGTKVAC